MAMELQNDYEALKRNVSKLPLIGRGSFGSVYGGEKTAHKIVDVDGSEWYDEHLREFWASTSVQGWQLLKEYGSDYLVTILGVKIGTYGFVVSMERADCSLFDYVVSDDYEARGSDISPLFQLQYALEFLHKKGWWHRDIKPGNILKFSRGSLLTSWKLCDFGQARPQGSELGITDSTPQCQTTYLYATPALLQQVKRPTIGCEADYYALGASILHALFPKSFYLRNETEKCGLHFALHVIPNLLRKAETRLLSDEMDLLWKWVSFEE